MAPGCFSQSTNAKESVSLKQAQLLTSSVKLHPMVRADKPFTPPSSLLPLQHRKRSSIDSFEILEQTIIKQKRLNKLKNTDLRKKVLLKRTFDLICDIMDTENGFTEVEDEPSISITSNIPQETSELELELHDFTNMDEGDREENTEEPEKSSDLEPTKADEADSQVLPCQFKRRASCDDEETFFYESHSTDQQLNWRIGHKATVATLSDLKMYNDEPTATGKSAKSRRTDHQRSAKRIRMH